MTACGTAWKNTRSPPESFARYYANPWIAAASEAWLGPRFQMTAQVNLVHLGGQPQTAHRDYHLGFMSQGQAALLMHAHLLTAALTLQGAIAHVDIPIEAGPTKLLPHSQKYQLGYLAYHEQAFKDVFEERFVQVALEQVATCSGSTPRPSTQPVKTGPPDVERLEVNLFQVSFGLRATDGDSRPQRYAGRCRACSDQSRSEQALSSGHWWRRRPRATRFRSIWIPTHRLAGWPPRPIRSGSDRSLDSKPHKHCRRDFC